MFLNTFVETNFTSSRRDWNTNGRYGLSSAEWTPPLSLSLLSSTSAVIRRWDPTNRRINVASAREIIHTVEPSNSRSPKPRRRQVRESRKHRSLSTTVVFTSVFLCDLKTHKHKHKSNSIQSLSSCSPPAERPCEGQRVLFTTVKLNPSICALCSIQTL